LYEHDTPSLALGVTDVITGVASACVVSEPTSKPFHFVAVPLTETPPGPRTPESEMRGTVLTSVRVEAPVGASSVAPGTVSAQVFRAEQAYNPVPTR
jgi:hypothetical protein